MELGGFGREYRAMILFAGYVGLRPGELFALRRDDLEGHLCLIERSPSKTGKIGPTKTSGACTVIVPPPAQDALRDVPPHGSGLVFTSPADRMWAQPAPPRLLVAAKALHETAPPRLLRAVPHSDYVDAGTWRHAGTSQSNFATPTVANW